MGAYGLRRIQVGAESTKGTAVTAGKVLTGIDGQIEDMSELQTKKEEYYSGLLPGSQSGTPVFVSDTCEVAIEGDATYENLSYLLNSHWKSVSPTTAATSDTWLFPAPTTAANSPKTMSIQTGDDTEQLKCTYGLLPELNLKGSVNDTLKVSGKFAGRSVTAASTGFDSATNISATTMPFNLCKLYVDASSGTVGTTLLSATLIELDLKSNSGVHHKQFADGNLPPTSDGQARPEVTLDVVLEYNSNAITVRDDWKNKREKRLRFLSGTATTANPSFYVDMAGYWVKAKKIGERDGNTTIAATFRCLPAGTTTADYVNWSLINSVTGL